MKDRKVTFGALASISESPTTDGHQETYLTCLKDNLSTIQETNDPALQGSQEHHTSSVVPILITSLSSESDLLQSWEEQERGTVHLAEVLGQQASLSVDGEDVDEESLAEGAANLELGDLVEESGVAGLES